MAVYRFRISFEEAEDVYREIDIQGKQTFEDLHRAIQEAIGFDNTKDASFYMSDDYWHRGEEIALNPRKTDDDDDDDRNRKPAPKLMGKSKIVGFIDDPHQKLLYIFDPAVQWTFFVELVKILNEDPKIIYPKCTKSSGAAPKQYKVVTAPPVDDDEFGDLDDEEDGENRKERVFHAEEEYDGEESGSSDDEESGSDSESEESEGESDSDEAGEQMGGLAEGGEEDY